MFVFNICVYIYKINSKCLECCNGCCCCDKDKGFVREIKITSNSFTLDGKLLKPLVNKPVGVVNNNYIDCTNIYKVDTIGNFRSYEIKIEDKKIMNNPYIIAFVELINSNEEYIISCLDYNLGNCKGLFKECYSIIEIAILESRNVTNMSGMFYDCSKLCFLNFNNFNTSKVTDMSNMFKGCSSLMDINLSSFNTINVTDMSYMFYKCSSLSTFPNISKWKTTKIKNLSYMFYECSSLTFIPDIVNWRINIGTNTNYILKHCLNILI